ncbi:hypothetical protein BU16DRAFT_577499 [Lophium mytilinum]|uniref:Heterokaryon incompatibility domain-containing protein n=1 Tax=Lophium mytilinum TaxID=390894 RepID=A0A6A6RC37_9PEZI|nr:hypothetical protein BU16DRAFT_577499 [Lophium mytilinum]
MSFTAVLPLVATVLYAGGRIRDQIRRSRREKLSREEEHYRSDISLTETSEDSSDDRTYRGHPPLLLPTAPEAPLHVPLKYPYYPPREYGPSNQGFGQETYSYDGWYNMVHPQTRRHSDEGIARHRHPRSSFDGLSQTSCTNARKAPESFQPQSAASAFSRSHHLQDVPLYPYSKLQGAHTIRLIELHPARYPGDDLHCSFYQADLVDNNRIPLSYEALSYAWGKPELPNVMWCDDTPSFRRGSRSPSERRDMWHLRITDSLNAALRAYRSTTKEIVFWIDAVCINQADSGEKMHQVKQMKRIYQEATRVQVWLGDEGQGGGQTLRWLEELGRWRQQFYPFTTMKLGKDVPQTVADSMQPSLPTLQHFLTRSWFRRRWVIQEVTTSRAAILSCGPYQCDWDDFAEAIKFLYDVDSRITLFRGTVLGVLQGLRLMDLMKSCPELTQGFGLLDSLNLFHAADTARAQDRILALLSFAENAESYIDFGQDYYTQSPEAFYTKFARNALERTQTLDILHLAGTFRPLDSASWVPDWRSSPRYRPFLNIRKYSAGIGGPQDSLTPPTPIIFSSGTNRLVIEGFVFDTIEDRSDSISKTPSFDDICSMIPQYRAVARYTVDDDQETRRKLATTLIADQALSERFPWLPMSRDTEEKASQTRLRRMLESGFEQLCRTAATSGGVSPGLTSPTPSWPSSHSSSPDTPRKHEYAQRYAALVSVTMSGRCLFRTASGHIGIGPEDLRNGDRIVVFVGARTPFVIRPGRGREGFEVVGDCYVHGIMKGEALGRDEWDQFVIA